MAGADDPKFLAWIDLETTGLDERRDHILEVALVLTRWEPTLEEVASLSLVVKPDAKDWEDRMDETVRKMHDRSRLLREVPYGVSIHEAKWAIEDLFHKNGAPGDYMLAGSGVHFDRRFIAEDMRVLIPWLAYPIFDVGVVRRFVRLSGAEVETDLGRVKHRAMADVVRHIAEAREYLAWMAS